MTLTSSEPISDSSEDTTEKYLVVSTDTHAGPSPVKDLRAYCPKQHLDDFDRFVADFQRGKRDDLGTKLHNNLAPATNPLPAEAHERQMTCPGQADMSQRLRDMNTDGVAAEVIFAGGGNDEPLPFVGAGFGGGITTYSEELSAGGAHIWNARLPDSVSAEPHRHVGV